MTSRVVDYKDGLEIAQWCSGVVATAATHPSMHTLLPAMSNSVGMQRQEMKAAGRACQRLERVG